MKQKKLGKFLRFEEADRQIPSKEEKREAIVKKVSTSLNRVILAFAALLLKRF